LEALEKSYISVSEANVWRNKIYYK
jgi:hypothetical protein